MGRIFYRFLFASPSLYRCRWSRKQPCSVRRRKFRVIILRQNNDSMELAASRILRNAAGDANRLTVVSISRAVLYFLGVSYRSSECNEFISAHPPPPPRSWRTYLCLPVYMYVLTFRLRDFFIFAQSAYPSPFASEDASSPCAYLSHFSLFSVSLFLGTYNPACKRAKEKKATHHRTSLSRFIPTVTDIVKREETITRVQTKTNVESIWG